MHSRGHLMPRPRDSTFGELSPISENGHPHPRRRHFTTPQAHSTSAAQRNSDNKRQRPYSAPQKQASVTFTPSTTSRRTLMPPPTLLFPQIPSYLAHEDQLPPTPEATQLLYTLLPRPLTDWKLADFTTHGHVGLSTLISLFVDYATRAEDISTAHRGLVAKRACITHPSRLLHMIRTGDRVEDYVQRSRTMIPPPCWKTNCALLGRPTWSPTMGFALESTTRNSPAGTYSRSSFPTRNISIPQPLTSPR